ncbi:hypothetical protein BH23VER1_BH23VER1_28480 [soil metagenome]
MRRPIPLRPFALLIPLAATAGAQTLYEEGFDSGGTAKVEVRASADTVVEFIDYSNFSLGTAVVSIPEAPNPVMGSAPTRGVVIQANLTSGAPNVVNLVALEAVGGDPAEFGTDEPNYRLSYDMFLSLSADALSANSSTEIGIWGVGYLGGIPLGRSNRDDPDVFGTWGWIAGDGGFGSEDAVLRVDGAQVEARANTTNAGLFESAFPDGSPASPAPNNTWVHVVVTVLNGEVIVEYNGVEFFRTLSESTEGFALIGYEDPFGSISADPDFQLGVFDNFRVEVAVEPTITIGQSTLFQTLNVEGETSVATFVVGNPGDADLTVSEVNFTGADAAAFALATALPVVVPAGSTATIDVTFTAMGDTGAKTAQVEFVSDDAQEPSVIRPLSALFASPLLAHYKLDELSGIAVVDASGNAANGAYNITDPLEYGAMALASGTSIGFTAAQFPAAGNFAILPPIHVPTTSISLWILPEPGDGGQDTLFNRDPFFNAADAIYGCFIDDSGTLTFRSNSQVVLQSEPGAITDGEIYHVAITHLDEDGFGNETATRSRMYINGTMVDENLEPAGFDDYPAGASTSSLFLATRSAAGSGFDGLMDDVQVYSIELSPDQVFTLFTVPGNTIFETIPGLVITGVSYDQALEMLTLTWDSLPGRRYILSGSDDLEEWLEVTDGIESAGFSTQTEISDPPAPPHFYRIEQE